MYRGQAEDAKPPTVIEYRAHRVRPWYLLLATIIVGLGLASLGSLHATRLTCAKGSCHVQRYALAGAIDEQVPVDDIASFDVRVRSGSKGGKYAEVRLVMTTASGRQTLDLETGAFGHVDPAKAQNVRALFLAFEERRTPFDVWLSLGPLTNIIMSLFGLLLFAMGTALLREQLIQLRTARIVVDHTRQVVTVRKQVVPWNEIDDTTVEAGRALFWSSGKHEYIVGHRLVVVLKSGAVVPVTVDFRAGDAGVHERAQKALASALGRS